MLLAAFVAVQPGMGQGGCSQNDAGQCGDAGNGSGSARVLPDSIGYPSFHRYPGTLMHGESEDWYRFTIPSFSLTSQGRPAVEITLFSDWGNAFEVELYKSGAMEEPAASGRGASGKFLQHQADASGTWFIRVFTGSGQVGHYDFTLALIKENDGGSQRDAALDGNGVVGLGQQTGTSVDMTGAITRGDAGDGYRLNTQSSSATVVVALKYPRSMQLDLSVSGGLMSNPLASQASRSGPGFKTFFITGAGTTSYDVNVEPARAGDAGPYSLSVIVGADEAGDPGGGDAGPDPAPAREIEPGLYIGNSQSVGNDLDVYKLEGVGVGDVVELGVSAYRASAIRHHYAMELLHRPGTTGSTSTIASIQPCNGAGGLTHTATAAGEYYVRVLRDASCSGAAVSGGQDNYALFYTRSRHNDPVAGDGDAPGTPGSAPSYQPDAPASEPHTAWQDRSDGRDYYSLGSLSAGTTVRIYVASVVPDLALQLAVTDAGSATLGSTVSSTGGVAAFHQTVVSPSLYRFAVIQPGASAEGEGPYRVFVETGSNEPPPMPVLQPIRPLPDDTGRTTVTLRWTPSPDLDFARYEVYGATGAAVSPGPGTLRATVTERPAQSGDFVTKQVTGLNAATQYTFLVRTVDGQSNGADSNTRTAETDGVSIGNSPPQLSNGQVNPQQGTTSTQFTFSVEYRDADGDAAQDARVFISGTPHQMTASGSNYASGVTYSFSDELSAGNKQFYFEFSDGVDTDRDPDTGAHNGPSVQEGDNAAPTDLQVTANPQQGEAPLEVNFHIQATDPDGDSLSYRWTFGDGGSSSAQSPTHTYQEPGVYTATGFATDGRAESSKAISINVVDPDNAAPTVDPAAEPSSGLAPLAVQFRSNAQDSDGSIASIEWDFDNGNGIQVESRQSNPSHTYDEAGTYVATVKATDDGRRTATATVTVTVSTQGNAPPTVAVNATPQSGEAPLTVDFRADGFDPDGDALTFQWDFDAADGVSNEASGAEVTHEYPVPGTFTATVRAADTGGATATATVRITVMAPPGGTGDLFIEADPRRGDAPLNVTFTADTSNMAAPPRTYAWDFGDGGTSNQGPTTNHVFESDGRYEVTLNVTDTEGGLHTSTIVIEVGGGGGSPGFGFTAIVAGLAVAAFLAVRRARSGKGS